MTEPNIEYHTGQSSYTLEPRTKDPKTNKELLEILHSDLNTFLEDITALAPAGPRLANAVMTLRMGFAEVVMLVEHEMNK